MIRSKHHSSLSDQELLKQFLTSDDKLFFEILFNRNSHLLLACALKFLKDEQAAYDAVIATFEMAMLKIKTSLPSNVGGWLYTITRNNCLAEIAAQKVFNENHSLEIADDQNLDAEETFMLLRKAIDELPENQKKCIVYFYLEKLSYLEIQYLTMLTYKQVKSNIQNGKRNLKINLLKLLRDE